MLIMPGLVSRGPGCARAHHPGIYTRVLDFDNHKNYPEKIKVKSHLPWIYSIVWRRVKYKVVPKGEGESEVVVRNSELLSFIS